MNNRGRPKATVDFKLSKNRKCNPIFKIANIFLYYVKLEEIMMLARLQLVEEHKLQGIKWNKNEEC